jgi:hypothetical protein
VADIEAMPFGCPLGTGDGAGDVADDPDGADEPGALGDGVPAADEAPDDPPPQPATDIATTVVRPTTPAPKRDNMSAPYGSTVPARATVRR